MKVLFLDLDGVLNGHEYCPASRSNTLNKECVAQLNRIIDAHDDLKIVLSSAWRYMILGGAMTLQGFSYLMQTHGVHCVGRLIGHTVADEKIPERRDQIHYWLSDRPEVVAYVVLDDMILGTTYQVRTGEKVGLTTADADKAIAMLWEQYHAHKDFVEELMDEAI